MHLYSAVLAAVAATASASSFATLTSAPFANTTTAVAHPGLNATTKASLPLTASMTMNVTSKVNVKTLPTRPPKLTLTPMPKVDKKTKSLITKGMTTTVYNAEVCRLDDLQCLTWVRCFSQNTIPSTSKRKALTKATQCNRSGYNKGRCPQKKKEEMTWRWDLWHK